MGGYSKRVVWNNYQWAGRIAPRFRERERRTPDEYDVENVFRYARACKQNKSGFCLKSSNSWNSKNGALTLISEQMKSNRSCSFVRRKVSVPAPPFSISNAINKLAGFFA